MIYRLCQVVCLTLIFGSAINAEIWAQSCPETRADIRFDSRFSPPVLDQSLSKRQMQSMGPRAGVYGKGSVIGGLYRPEHEYRINFRQTQQRRGPQTCVLKIKVTFTYRLKQTIFIPKDYARRSCQFNAVYAHEVQHSDFEETSFKLFKPKFEQAIYQEIKRYGDQPLSVVQREVKRAVDVVFQVFENDRKRRHATIDNPTNYARESKRCSAW